MVTGNLHDTSRLQAFGHGLCGDRVDGSSSISDKVSSEAILRTILGCRTNTIIIGKANAIELSHVFRLEIGQQSCHFGKRAEARIRVDSRISALVHNDISILRLTQRMELGSFGALHAVVGPHDLLDASVWKGDRLEEGASGIVGLEGAMILWVPISREVHMLVAGLVCGIIANALDNRVDCLAVSDGQGASSVEIILVVDDNQCSDISISLNHFV